MPAVIKIECEPKKDESKKGVNWTVLMAIFVGMVFILEVIFDAPFFNVVAKATCSLCSFSSYSTRPQKAEVGTGNRKGRNAKGRRLLAAIKRVAEQRNYPSVSRGRLDSVHITVGDGGPTGPIGNITFSLRRGGVTMSVYPKYVGLWQSEVESRKRELRQIGRKLMRDAQAS